MGLTTSYLSLVWLSIIDRNMIVFIGQAVI